MSLEEFYSYIEYLDSIGVDLELLTKFEKITSNTRNENPYQLLESLIPIMPRANQHVYSYIRNK